MFFGRNKKEEIILAKRTQDLDILRDMQYEMKGGLKQYERKIDRSKAVMAEMDAKIEAEPDDLIAERYQMEFETSEAGMIAASAEQMLIRENVYVLNEIIEAIDNWLIKSKVGNNLKYLSQIDAYLNIRKLKKMVGEPSQISGYLKGIAKIILETRQEADKIADILQESRQIKTTQTIRTTSYEREPLPAFTASKALAAKREAIRQKRELEALASIAKTAQTPHEEINDGEIINK